MARALEAFVLLKFVLNLNGLASLSEERGRRKEGRGREGGSADVLVQLLDEPDNSG